MTQQELEELIDIYRNSRDSEFSFSYTFKPLEVVADVEDKEVEEVKNNTNT